MARSDAAIAPGSGVWGISPIAALSLSPEMQCGTRQRYSSSESSRPIASNCPMVLIIHQLIGRSVNLLVLDEPTNHLDLPAIEQLESALADYPGTLLLVTHDRRMLDAVTVSRQIAVEGGRVTEG